MKKDFQLGITSALAIAMTTAGCGPTADVQQFADRDTAVCVDRSGNRVSDYQCNRNGGGGGSNAFLWYYMGRNAALPYIGENVGSNRYRGSGSFRPAAGARYAFAPKATAVTRSAAVSRGGFGSSARSGFSVSS